MSDKAKGIKKKSSNNSDLRTMATSSAKKRHKKQQKHNNDSSSSSSSSSKNFHNHNDDVTHLQSRQPTNDTTSSMSHKQPSRDHLHDRHFNQSASADDSSLSLCSNSNGPPRFNGCGSLDSLSDVASIQEPIALPKDYQYNKVSKSSKRSKRPFEDEESYEKRTNQQQPPKLQPPIKYNSSPLSLRSHSPSGAMLEIPNIPSMTSSRTSGSDITVPKPHRLRTSSFSIPIRNKSGTNVHRKKCAAANFYNPTMSEDDDDDDTDDRSARGTKNAISSFTNRSCPSWEFNANGSFELQDHGSSLFTMTNLLPSFSWGETRQNSHSFDNTSVAMRSNGSGNNSVMMKLDESEMTHDDDDGINCVKHEKQKQQQQEEEDAIITDAFERQDLVKTKKKKKRVSINRDEHVDKQRVNHKLIFTKEKKSDKFIKSERAFHKPNSYKSSSSSKSKRVEPNRYHPLSCSSASNSSSQKSSNSTSTPHKDTNAATHTSPHHPPAMDSMGSHYGNNHPPPPPPHGYHGYPSPYHHPYSNGYVPPLHMMYAAHPIPHHHPYTIPYESRSDHNSPHQSSSVYTNDRNYAAFCPPPTSMAVPRTSKQRSYLIPRNCGSSAVNMEGNDASALQPRSQPPNLSNFIGRGVYNWTKEEDLRLSSIMKKYKNPMDWEPIAKEHARGKTPKECHERWIRYLKPGVRKGQWQDHEDAIVVEAVSNSTEQPFTRWSDLAQRLPGRVGKQIRDRWVNHLNPHINHMPFSKEDDKLLYKGYLDAGKKWVEISTKYFNSTRSENHIKNRWYSASFKKFITAEYGADAYNCSRTNKSRENQVKDSCQSSRDIKVESTANKVSLS